MEYRDYYQALGVARTATPDEIKKAYRRLARKFHPDVSKEANAEQKFKEVQEAYEVLKDTEKRAAYDQLGANWREGQSFRPPPDFGSGFEFRGGPPPGAQGGDFHFQFDGEPGEFSDFFSSLFGRGGRAGFAEGARRRSRDHHARIDLTLEEAYRGGPRMLELKRPLARPDGGVEVATHTVRVTVPPGVNEGQLIRLAGQGEPGAGGAPPGDLYLEVHVRPDSLYQLDGRDVTLTLPVAPWEAALGSAVPTPTLGGTVELRIPPGSQAGTRLRLRGRGLPGQPPGDQYVVLKVVLPPAQTDEARAAYERLKRELPFDARANFPPKA